MHADARSGRGLYLLNRTSALRPSRQAGLYEGQTHAGWAHGAGSMAGSRRARRVTCGTVSLGVFLQASGQELAALGEPYVYAWARAQDFRHGFFDQTAHLWSSRGLLLASADQIVYYKE